MRQLFSPTAYGAECVYSTMLWNRLFCFKYSGVLLRFSTAIFDGAGKIGSAARSGLRCKLSGPPNQLFQQLPYQLSRVFIGQVAVFINVLMRLRQHDFWTVNGVHVEKYE
jgi:hypothetical protein